MRVRWTKPAIKDLDEIEDYIAKDDAERANLFVNKIIDLAESLEHDWNRGTNAKWTSDKSVRELYYGEYAIVYEVLEKEIQIHEIHHSAKMKRHFMR
jgi:plasmid stabilization system protein ParE